MKMPRSWLILGTGALLGLVGQLVPAQPGLADTLPEVENEGLHATEMALGMGNLALAAFNGVQSGRPERNTWLAITGIGVGFAGFALSSHDDAELSALDACAGAASVFMGMVQLARPRPAPSGESGLSGTTPRFRVGPVVHGGEQMLAVNVRF